MKQPTRARAFVGLLVAALVACDEKVVEVFPNDLQIAAGAATEVATVDVYARFRKKKGAGLLDTPIGWTTSDAGTTITTSPDRRTATLVVARSPARTFTVLARAEGRTDELTIRVAQPSGDHATAAAFQTPSVVLTFEAPDCPSEQTVAFERAATLAPRGTECQPGDAVGFSGYAPPVRFATDFGNGDDVVALPSSVTLRTMAVKVWLVRNSETFGSWGLSEAAISQLGVDRTAAIDDALILANGVFVASRVGLALVRPGAPTWIQSSARNCGDLLEEVLTDEQLSNVPGGPDLWEPGAINVYLMENFTSGRGEYCRSPGGAPPNNVIRIQSDALASTLVHELGHYLGLLVPWGENARRTGHVDGLKGFAKDNVMYGRVNLESNAPRTRFSVGQVYRMHFDRRSALPMAASRDCGCATAGATCGALGLDVRPLAGITTPVGGGAHCEVP